MKRYEIFRSLKDGKLECHVKKHELIGVAYGNTIDDASEEIDKCIETDLIADEDNIYEKYSIDIQPFDPHILRVKRYQYAALGVLSPHDENAPKNIMYEYGIKELELDETPAW